MKKKSEQQKENDERAQLAAKLREQEELSRLLQEEEPKLEISEQEYKPSPKTDLSDWKQIAKDYQEEMEQEPAEDGTLNFPSREAAVQFFEKQAQKGRQFLANELGTDFHVFSTGDGQLYKGTLSEIQAQLKDAIQQNPGNEKTQAGLDLINRLAPTPSPKPDLGKEMREKMRALREEQEPPQQTMRETTPNPLSTKPKPMPE
ncbi:hypothetical protein [Legionella spiritensis]|uniref:Substrate of the Dot/Icm secretion system n=1 Tax=Legionella spiritensis TaxID=452 RepID=A0A0W0YWQ3_LEGSP|nr:hypothetical protein [Legionella spiritensis]KTD61349.1 substrate of the Dot/Icm secretion system [Legionella spiritensis]SNV33837.1 Dot/Icm secretion system substrate [Legionella spiritensis]